MSGIVLVGGAGFVGRHVAAALLEAGEQAATPSHDEFDIARAAPEALAARLAGARVVVNCAGLARDARVDNLQAVHVEGARRLARACQIAGVGRLVHISALGAGRDDSSRFQSTKGEAEDVLRAVEGLEVCIVRPSLAIGSGGATGDFFGALAALPFPPRLGPGTWRVQPLHVAELAGLIAKLALAPQVPKSVDAVGPAPMTTDELERGLRGWLGLPSARFLPLPRFALGALAWLNEIVEVGPGDRELVELLERGNVGDPAGIAAVLGRPPRSLWQSLALAPATTADLWRARLYFVQPLLRISLALLWIGTGLVSLGPFPPAESYVMLAEVGVHGPIAELALFGGAGVNLALGGMLLANWRPARTGLAMLALLVVYTAVGLLLPPEYWLNPFAPIGRFLRIGAALIALIAMERPARAVRRLAVEGRGVAHVAREPVIP
jgi:uncharacterized protein YbjT (DUF2867 family)